MDISELKKKSADHIFHRHPWEITRGNIIIDLLRKAGKFPSDHIADIGSGDGYIAGVLTTAGIARSYSAFDNALDADLIASLKKEIPQARFFRDLETASGQVPDADVILILDVLEHVPDDGSLLAAIRRNLSPAPNAKWIITVPAFQSLFSRHDVLLGHYRRYTLSSLTRICQANHLAIEKKGYFFSSLFLLRILIRRAEKLRRKKEDSTIQDWKGGRTLTALLVRLLWIDYKFGQTISKIGINIPGLSCYCICHQLPS
jgi:2-polyprenyl-3-methyl-5-hydroxy-6-metoxy-1,4-benzoquinol methylase